MMGIDDSASAFISKHSKKNSEGLGRRQTPHHVRRSDDSTKVALISLNILESSKGLEGDSSS